MANPEHVAVAKGRTYSVARWREAHYRSRAKLDLSQAVLSGIKMPGVDLSHDDLTGIDLTKSDLHNGRFAGSKLESAHLSRSNLSWADLAYANLRNVSLIRSNLRGASLHRADLQGSDLSHCDLSFADLTEANLSGANLNQANLFLADLRGAKLRNASLHGTHLTIANLTKVDLRQASLFRTDLDGTMLAEVRLEMTLFADCDLSGTLCLSSAQHSGPSIIGLDTVTRSRGLIPPSFLREAGVPTALVELQDKLNIGHREAAHILVVGAEKDRSFVERLRADLLANGLGCWGILMDDEDGAVRDGMSPVSEQLTYYDQMLLVCSDRSLGSPYGWRFFEQIAQQPTSNNEPIHRVVCLSLDYALRTDQYPLAEELRRFPAVEFRYWRRRNEYTKSLDRLLGVLEEEPEQVMSEGLTGEEE